MECPEAGTSGPLLASKTCHMRAHAVKGGNIQKKSVPANGGAGQAHDQKRESESSSDSSVRSAEGSSVAEAALQRMSDDSAASVQLQELADLASSSGSIAEIAALQGGMGAESPMQRAALEEEAVQGMFAGGRDAVQRAAEEEEAPMQGKFTGSRGGALQRAAMEEEPAQGKFKAGADAVQRAAMEEEAPMQGKFTGSQGGALQRAAMEEEAVQGMFKAGADAVQRAAEEEEAPMQGKFESGSQTVQRKSGTGGDGKLPGTLQSGVESLSGQSMNDVKVHYNSPEPRQMEAHAFAQGSDIHVASGQEKHLPHEAWHVAQQKQGRVKPTTSMNGGVPVNDDPGLEREADVMGAKSLSKGAETAQKKDMEE